MDARNHTRPILTYSIASGEMHYAVQNERAVYLAGDLKTGFRLYGQIPDTHDPSSINLAEMLLEFAMAWNMPGDALEARHQMHVFGQHLGQALADQRAPAKSVNGVLRQAANALEDVFRSLDASFVYYHTRSAISYQLDPGPLQVIAGVTGVEGELELAHHALLAICQSVVGALGPELHIQLPSGPYAEQVIHVLASTCDWQLGGGKLADHQTHAPIEINSKSQGSMLPDHPLLWKFGGSV